MARRGRRKGKKRGKSRISGAKGILGKIPLIKNPTFQKAAAGIGTATLGVAVLNLVAPQFAQNAIVRPLLAFAGGDIPGVAAQLFLGGGLGNIFGGGGGGGAQAGGA